MAFRRRRLAPADFLRSLPEPTVDGPTAQPVEELYRMELRRSILSIAQLTQASETALVRAAVANARGSLPDLDE